MAKVEEYPRIPQLPWPVIMPLVPVTEDEEAILQMCCYANLYPEIVREAVAISQYTATEARDLFLSEKVIFVGAPNYRAQLWRIGY